MPLGTPSVLTTYSALVFTTPITLPSITPTANRLVIVAAASYVEGATIADITSITGCGLTWAAVDSGITFDPPGAKGRLRLFRALGAAPTTGQLTVNVSMPELDIPNFSFVVFEVGGVVTGGTSGSSAVVQTASNTGTTSCTATLGAFSVSTNATFGVFAIHRPTDDPAESMTPGSGFTTLQAFSVDNHLRPSILVEYKTTTDTTVDGSWVGNVSAGYGLELSVHTPVSIALTGSYTTSIALTGTT